MIFSMNSQDLLEGLNTVTRALSARSPKQILEGILITAAEGRIRMTCSDGSLMIECTNAAAIQEEGQAVLPGKLFTELIRKMPVGDVSVSVTDHRTAVIRCMKNRSSLAIMNADEYPEIQMLQAEIRLGVGKGHVPQLQGQGSFRRHFASGGLNDAGELEELPGLLRLLRDLGHIGKNVEQIAQLV